MVSNFVKCPRCGLKRSGPSIHCPVCGYEFVPTETAKTKQESSNSGAERPEDTDSKRSSGPSSLFPPFPKPSEKGTIWPDGKGPRGYPVPLSVPPEEVATDQGLGLMASLGWRRLRGTVIAIEPPYMAKPESNWLLKFILGIILSPFIIGLTIFLVIFSTFFSMFTGGRSGGPGLVSNIISQVVGFFLTGKLFGPKDQVPVRDIRLRDDSGQEHLVRIRGEIVAGNMNVGDVVEIEGYNRRGTLMVRRGWNKRTRSEIMIKYR